MNFKAVDYMVILKKVFNLLLIKISLHGNDGMLLFLARHPSYLHELKVNYLPVPNIQGTICLGVVSFSKFSYCICRTTSIIF